MKIFYAFYALLLLCFFFQTDAFPIEHNNLSTISVRADSEDKVPLKSVKLGSKDYDLKPLPKSDQGLYSDAYDIVGDFEKFPAILKVVNAPKGSEALDQTRKEIRFLTKVGLLLHSEASGTHHYIVLRNVRKDYPTKGSPGYKPLYEWYIENEDLRAEEMLGMFKQILSDRLTKFAAEDGLLYNDLNMANFFVDARIEKVMPIDWGAQAGGVEEVTSEDEAGEAQVKKFLDRLDKRIEKIDIRTLQALLMRRHQALRPNDVPKEE